MKQINFMEIEGIKIGHAQNLDAVTGCTVIISEKGAVVGVDVRGGAPGTRETDLLDPVNLVSQAHAILIDRWKRIRAAGGKGDGESGGGGG